MSISNFAIVKNKQFAQYKPMFFVQYTEKTTLFAPEFKKISANALDFFYGYLLNYQYKR